MRFEIVLMNEVNVHLLGGDVYSVYSVYSVYNVHLLGGDDSLEKERGEVSLEKVLFRGEESLSDRLDLEISMESRREEEDDMEDSSWSRTGCKM